MHTEARTLRIYLRQIVNIGSNYRRLPCLEDIICWYTGSVATSFRIQIRVKGQCAYFITGRTCFFWKCRKEEHWWELEHIPATRAEQLQHAGLEHWLYEYGTTPAWYVLTSWRTVRPIYTASPRWLWCSNKITSSLVRELLTETLHRPPHTHTHRLKRTDTSGGRKRSIGRLL